MQRSSLAGFLLGGLMLASGFSAHAAEPSPQPFLFTHTVITETTQLLGLSQTDFTDLLQHLSQTYATHTQSDTTWLSYPPVSSLPGLSGLLPTPHDSQPSAPAIETGGGSFVSAGSNGDGTPPGGQLAPGSGGMGDVAPIETPTTLRLTEVYANTLGNDLEEEYIEIQNVGDKPVSLQGWSLEDASGKRYVVKDDLVIAPQAFATINRAASKISLNNEDETLFLKSPDGTLIDQTSYNKTIEGSTFALVDGSWAWTSERTPGATNIQSVEVVDTEETESAVPTATALSVAAPVVTEPPIVESPSPVIVSEPVVTPTVVEPAAIEPELPLVKTIRLTELYPNTSGDDLVEEFVELQNIGTEAAPLKNWSLVDASGKTFVIADSIVLPPGEFYVLNRSTSKLSLNNDADTVILLSPDAEEVDEVAYTKTQDGFSLSLIGDVYVWTTPSANSSNIPPVAEVSVVQSNPNPSPTPASSTLAATTEVVEQAATTQTDLNAPDTTVVTVEGTALVAPGVLGKQFFYLSVNGQGIQVFKSDAVFPEINAGQTVRIHGELSTSREERRIKVTKNGSIEVLETRKELQPTEVDVANINAALHGQFLVTHGQVLTRSKDSIILEDAGVQLTIGVSEYANIDTSLFAKGDTLKIQGILVSQAGSLKLKPRMSSDIELITNQAAVAASSAATITSGKEQQQSNQAREAAVVAAGTGLVLIALLLRKFHPKLLSLYAPKTSLAVASPDVR